MAKEQARRKWQCPVCERRYKVSAATDNPSMCKNCSDQLNHVEEIVQANEPCPAAAQPTTETPAVVSASRRWPSYASSFAGLLLSLLSMVLVAYLAGILKIDQQPHNTFQSLLNEPLRFLFLMIRAIAAIVSLPVLAIGGFVFCTLAVFIHQNWFTWIGLLLSSLPVLYLLSILLDLGA